MIRFRLTAHQQFFRNETLFDEFFVINPMNVDTSGYDASQPIQIPGLMNALWGLLKTGQGISVIIAAGVIMGLGVMLWLSGDNTGRKTWIVGAIVALVVGEILIWTAPLLAVTLAHFAGAK